MSDPLQQAVEYLRLRATRGRRRVVIDRPILVAPTAPPEMPVKRPAASVDPRWREATTLDALNRAICACQACALGATRTKFVFGVGAPHARAVIIGEAPGADEDRQGEPFVGRAGQLLNKILEAIGLRREEVFICNILKCRPPNNRDPLPAEVNECEPYLHTQIELIAPAAILALGRIAANTLLKESLTMGKLRETVHTYRGVPLVATYHPSALLRNPEWKRLAWIDVKTFRRILDERIGIVPGAAGK